MRFLAFVAVDLLLFFTGQALLAQEQPRSGYSLKQEQPDTGTNIKRTIAKSNAVPFDKRYSELTPAEQASVKSQYEQMGPNDEPPYPLNGIGPIYKVIAAGQQRLRLTGALSLAVEVNSQGDATSISVLRAADPEMVNFVASVLIVQKFKPAVCDGKPCTMQFPFRIEFEMR